MAGVQDQDQDQRAKKGREGEALKGRRREITEKEILGKKRNVRNKIYRIYS